MKVAVFARAELVGDLTAGEHVELARLGLSGARALEWTLGRAAAHRVVGLVDVTVDAAGAPLLERGAISISHDGEWFAVATAEYGRVAVDLCERRHALRLSKILARLGVRAGDPCLNWAALECALKLRGLGVWNLLDTKVDVESRGDRAIVRGIGADLEVHWRAGTGYVLAWAELAEVPVLPALDLAVTSPIRKVGLNAPMIFGVISTRRDAISKRPTVHHRLPMRAKGQLG